MEPKRRNLAIAALALTTVLALAGCAAPDEARAQPTPEMPEDPVAWPEPHPTMPGDGAAEAEPHTIAHADALVWMEAPPSLPPGTRLAMLSGNATQPGPFAMRAEIPANVTIPPHTHPGTEHVTILNGTAWLGLGEDTDRVNATELGPGDYFVAPPGMVHWFATGNETVVLQLHGEGPWGINYVNPEDAPGAA